MQTFWVLNNYALIILCSTCASLCSEINFNKERLPVIIWWTDLLFPHEGKSSQIKCPNSTCLSSRRKNYKSDNVTIAYLFYGTDFDATKLPLPRTDNHIWALLHEESPMNNYIFSHSAGIKLFNYTSTFSRNSDFPLTTQYLPTIDYLTERTPIPLEVKNEYRANGTAPILYLQSHCNIASDRDRYVKNLMEHIRIDSYGLCLHNRDLPLHLVSTETHNDETLFEFISKYKFHIAFENAICDDYITEKLYRSLHVGSVPIYRGSPSIRDWVPTDTSVVIVDEFDNVQSLATFLTTLDNDDLLYSEYLAYRDRGISNNFLKEKLAERNWGVNDVDKIDFIRGFECYICDRIADGKNKPPSVANRNHMNCPQPHMSIYSVDKVPLKDDWVKEDWIESYWFALDQAKAIEMMIKNKENNTANFVQYLSSFKYHN